MTVEKESLELIALLLDNGADVNQPFMGAKRKAKKNTWTPLGYAIEKANPEIIQLLLEHDKIDMDALFAAEHEKKEVLVTPLIFSCMKDDWETARLLIDANCLVDLSVLIDKKRYTAEIFAREYCKSKALFAITYAKVKAFLFRLCMPFSTTSGRTIEHVFTGLFSNWQTRRNRDQ